MWSQTTLASTHRRIYAVFPIDGMRPTEVFRVWPAALPQLCKKGAKSLALSARSEKSEMAYGVLVLVRYVVCEQLNELLRGVSTDDFLLQFVLVCAKTDLLFRAFDYPILGDWGRRKYLQA